MTELKRQITARRTKTEIAADLLRVALGGAKRTHLVYKGFLNFKILDGHLDPLLNQGLLSKGEVWYMTTPRGRQFLRRYDTLMEMIAK